MRRATLRVLTAVSGTALALAGCAAPSDDDGEEAVRPEPEVRPVAAPARTADAVPIVVDTDLGGDDLAALAFLLRHPAVDVEAITVAGAGLVGCDPGVDVVADLLTALEEPPLPVACTTAGAGPDGRPFPVEWRRLAATGTGIARPGSTLAPEAEEASSLVGRLARRTPGLVLVALGPMTMPAELAETAPRSYGHLAGVHAMGGSVEGEPTDGVAEWNVAADPVAFATVLAAGVPLTIVPEDAVPDGTPALLASAPAVADVAATVDYPGWWDLAAAAALVTGSSSAETGAWMLDGTVPGRLVRSGDGDGDVRVVRSLDPDVLETAYAEALG